METRNEYIASLTPIIGEKDAVRLWNQHYAEVHAEQERTEEIRKIVREELQASHYSTGNVR